jgi:signal transduction histidine kinase
LFVRRLKRTPKSLEKERELNELKSRFVSTASHEFRTPLSAILSSTSLIKQYHDRKEPDKIDKHIERVKSSVNHLTTILNDFLSLSKLEEGRIEVNMSHVEVYAFMDEIHEEIKPILKTNQQFTVDLNHSSNELYTDPKLLRGILFNLISNASKYSEPGGQIMLGISSNENHTVIVCKDDGIGIPERDAKHVFDRFFRASNAANIQGTGLVLNIMRRYVDLLGGTIAFQSAENVGSVFTITLPFER